jgi:mono/diheme cytochrome c family protein
MGRFLRRSTLRALACCMIAGVAGGCGEHTPDVRPKQLAHGSTLYAVHCAACHGAKLEGQANWRERLPNGKLPAPPHDESGHTWHHPDALLFNIVKNGIEPYASPGYKSDMPAFADRLSDDDIRAVLAFIKSTWPDETRRLQEQTNAPPKR